LAPRTKIAAASGDNRAPNRRTATITGLTFASVRAMVALIFSRLAVGVKEVGNRGAAGGDGFVQDVLQRSVQLAELRLAEFRA
jgi:hypothetical protein